jgi:hypothetical protein
MQTNPERLRALLDAEAGGSDDLAPAGDPAVRAHLRFVTEALAANAAPAAAPALEAFAAALPGEFAAREQRLADELARIAEATALELDLQFGDEVADDPGIRAMIDRRMRISAWTRVFLDALDDARPGRPPVREEVLAWMGERQTQLADTIFAMDRRAKEAEMARGGPDAVANPEVVNRIGQAAMLQAHTRFLVEALAERI